MNVGGDDDKDGTGVFAGHRDEDHQKRVHTHNTIAAIADNTISTSPGALNKVTDEVTNKVSDQVTDEITGGEAAEAWRCGPRHHRRARDWASLWDGRLHRRDEPGV